MFLVQKVKFIRTRSKALFLLLPAAPTPRREVIYLFNLETYLFKHEVSLFKFGLSLLKLGLCFLNVHDFCLSKLGIIGVQGSSGNATAGPPRAEIQGWLAFFMS